MDFNHLTPADFQRLAVAALRHDLRHSRVTVKPFDPPYGVKDGGFDARVDDAIDGHPGPWRVDAKRVDDYDGARDELVKLLTRHHDLPIVLIVGARLTEAQHNALIAVGAKHSVKVDVRDGAWVEQVVIAHPWLHEWFFGDRRAAHLRPAALRSGESPTRAALPSEVAAVDAVVAGTGEAPIVLLNAHPTADPDRVLVELGVRVTECKDVANAAWVDADHERLVDEVRRLLGDGIERTLLLVSDARAAGFGPS